METATTAGYLEQLTRETRKEEAEIMAAAFRVGLRQLWREQVLSRYLNREIERDEAVRTVGIDWVDLADRQARAAKEDLEWALSS